jgi:von Willebrand factor type A domain-containing protein/putative Tad-like protein involved in Flp pilus assembly
MVLMTTLLGMAALSVDLGYVWNSRADLQRTVDAAALASAAMLAELDYPADRAREAAIEYVGRNQVMYESVPFSVTGVTLGRAELVDGVYVFQEVGDNDFPDAVRVQVSVTKDLFFARLFGRNEQTLSAEATALLVPRDIAIVADLSASHNDDSELGSYRDTNINIWDVWDALPGGTDDAGSLWQLEDLDGIVLDGNGFNSQTAGPGYGLMRRTRWGTEDIDPGYDPSSDPGLIYLPRYGTGHSDWNSALVNDFLAEMRFENNSQYSNDELAEIVDTGHHNSSSRYRRQVAVALGLARWDSGKPGGAWQNIPGATNGDGDDLIDWSEVTWLETFLGESGDRWYDYIYWDASSWSRMEGANPEFRNAFGAKTLTNYLLERRWSNALTPELAATPSQPMQAVKDAVELMVTVVGSFENDDQLALDIYGYSVRHRVGLVSSPNLDDVSTGVDGLTGMQAGHFDGWTNMGGGLEYGIETLSQAPARSASHKMIVLLTDGQANITPNGQWPSGSWNDQQDILEQARQYVLDQAAVAADRGIRIFAVSVGSYADSELMQQVADISNGEHLQATSNDINVYQSQLEDIFIRLGGKRPVELIN